MSVLTFKYDIYWNNPTSTKLTVSSEERGWSKDTQCVLVRLVCLQSGAEQIPEQKRQVQDSFFFFGGGVNIDISPQCDLNCRPVANIDFRWRLRLSEGGGVDVLLLSLRGGGGGGGGGHLLLTNHLQYLVLSLHREQMKRNSVKI